MKKRAIVRVGGLLAAAGLLLAIGSAGALDNDAIPAGPGIAWYIYRTQQISDLLRIHLLQALVVEYFAVRRENISLADGYFFAAFLAGH